MEPERTGGAMSSAILSPEDARNLSICLLGATDRIPGISNEARLVLLGAAGLLAEHSCSAVIAQAETDQLLDRTNRLEAAPAEVAGSVQTPTHRGVRGFLRRLASACQRNAPCKPTTQEGSR